MMPLHHSPSTLLVRLAALALVALSAATTASSASSGLSSGTRAARDADRRSTRAPERAPRPLLVPDLHRQPYVFAKSILQDAGFSWRVVGAVQGYAGNTVTWQAPAAGTRVVDTGAPRVSLRLGRPAGYRERGIPSNVSPRRATPLVLAD
jgi:hypothetical protein